MSQPLVSVLLPIKSLSVFAPKAVASILNQTHQNIELVIVGQSDVSKLQTQLPDDPRITIIARDAPGIVGALNTGLNYCRGDYIARMDADDIALPNRMESQLTLSKAYKDSALISTCVEFFSDSECVGDGYKQYAKWLNSLLTPEAIYDACLIESPMPHPGFFAHKSVWQKIGLYRDNDYPEDYDMVLRSWLQAIPMCKPEPILLRWRDHADRLTRTDKRYSRLAFTQLKAQALAHISGEIQARLNNGIWICGTGRNARNWHDALQSQNLNVSGFVDLETENRKHQKRHLPVITYDELLDKRGRCIVISAITNSAARDKLLSWFIENEMTPWRDFIIGG